MSATGSRKALLFSGIAAAFVFVLTNVLAGTLWSLRWTDRPYDYLSQSISDLSAIGAPTYAVAYPLTILYGLLMTAFGVGVWLLGRGNRLLRLTAALLLGYSLLGLVAAIFFPNRLTGDIANAADNILYVVPMALSIFCILFAIAAGAIAFRNWFRTYSLGTLALFAALTLLSIFVFPTVAAEPVVRTGLQERTMMFFNLLWVVLLAFVLRRAENMRGRESD